MSSWVRFASGALAALLLLSIGASPTRSQEDDINALDDQGSIGAVAEDASKPADNANLAERTEWLSARIEALVAARQHLAGARVGVAVTDLASGEPLYQRSADDGFNVASNVKIITTVTALSLLGPDFSFRTTLHAKKIEADGAVSGDLYVRGYGDPTLGTDGLDELVDQLVQVGVTAIRGGLVIDASYFDGEESPPHFDAQPDEEAYFRAPIGAVSLNFNQVSVVVTPSRAGVGPAAVVVVPPSDYVRVVGTVDTVARGRTRIRMDSEATQGALELRIGGQMRAHQGAERFRRRVPDPTQYFGATLRELLEQRGIRVGKKRIRTGQVPELWPVIATRSSPPLAEVVRGLGKHSNNYVAEMLLKVIGAEVVAQGERPATWKDGLAAVQRFLADEVGLPAGSYRYENGSGLYDSNRFSPNQVARVLAFGYRDFRYAPDLVSSLSIAGVDGTLRRRMEDGPAAGRVRGKTGTLAQVSALSGYAALDTRTPLVFAILVNDQPRGYRAKREARSLQDEIAAALVQFLDSPPSP